MLARREHFDRLYAAWLNARAIEADASKDDTDEVSDSRTDATDEAARQLLAMPAFLDWMIWKKWEVLELYIGTDAADGGHTDNRTVMALGCIKADLLRLGIGDGSDK